MILGLLFPDKGHSFLWWSRVAHFFGGCLPFVTIRFNTCQQKLTTVAIRGLDFPLFICFFFSAQKHSMNNSGVSGFVSFAVVIQQNSFKFMQPPSKRNNNNNSKRNIKNLGSALNWTAFLYTQLKSFLTGLKKL